MSVYCKLIDITKTSVSLISGQIVGIGCKCLSLNDFISEVGMPDVSNAEQVLLYSWLPMLSELRVSYEGKGENRLELVFENQFSPVILKKTFMEKKIIDYIHSV